MKKEITKKSKQENISRFKAFVRNILESLIRKTDSEKRTALFGGDPFKD